MQTVTETLEFETPHFLQSLFAHDLELLKLVETSFSVRITTRDGWIKLSGAEDGLSGASELFKCLENARRSGAEITAPFFKLVTEAVADGDAAEMVESVLEERLLGTSRRPPVMPKTKGQLRYLRAMRHHEVVFGLGSAGTGKTYLAMARALASLKDHTVNRVVLARPAVEAGEALGFLPGDLKEKIFPYLRPLYDALYDMLEPEEVEKFIDRGLIEIAPLAYMRGRTLSNAFVILDEAQNTTREQMLMFLTRLGPNSRCAITGDPSQVDLRKGTPSGLAEAMRVLPGIEGIEFIYFEAGDVVRHPVVQRIIEAYENYQSAGDSGGNGSKISD